MACKTCKTPLDIDAADEGDNYCDEECSNLDAPFRRTIHRVRGLTSWRQSMEALFKGLFEVVDTHRAEVAQEKQGVGGNFHDWAVSQKNMASAARQLDHALDSFKKMLSVGEAKKSASAIDMQIRKVVWKLILFIQTRFASERTIASPDLENFGMDLIDNIVRSGVPEKDSGKLIAYLVTPNSGKNLFELFIKYVQTPSSPSERNKIIAYAGTLGNLIDDLFKMEKKSASKAKKVSDEQPGPPSVSSSTKFCVESPAVLPENWFSVYDKTCRAYYFFNPIASVRSWAPPTADSLVPLNVKKITE